MIAAYDGNEYTYFKSAFVITVMFRKGGQLYIHKWSQIIIFLWSWYIAAYDKVLVTIIFKLFNWLFSTGLARSMQY